MYTQVTVPLDGSALAEAALIPAAALARRHHAPVRVVSVGASDREQVDLKTYHQALDEDGVLEAHWLAEVLTDDGPGVAGTIQSSLQGPAELLCLATRGHGAVGTAVLGSVAEGVLARHPDPVLMVGPTFDPTQPLTFSTMVVCLDGSAGAEEVIPAARAWAKELGMCITLLHIAPPPAQPDAEVPPGREHDAEERDWEVQAGRIAYLQRVAAGLAGEARLNWDIARSDNPAAAICRFAATVPGAVVAIAARATNGLRRLALGSVAMQVAHGSPVPVLVVRSSQGPSSGPLEVVRSSSRCPSAPAGRPLQEGPIGPDDGDASAAMLLDVRSSGAKEFAIALHEAGARRGAE